MKKLKLDAWTLSQVQDVLSLLHLIEADGITDLPIARQQVQHFIDDRAREVRALRKEESITREKVRILPVSFMTCPSCGQKTFREIAPVDGVKRVGCKNCYYSRIV